MEISKEEYTKVESIVDRSNPAGVTAWWVKTLDKKGETKEEYTTFGACHASFHSWCSGGGYGEKTDSIIVTSARVGRKNSGLMQGHLSVKPKELDMKSKAWAEYLVSDKSAWNKVKATYDEGLNSFIVNNAHELSPKYLMNFLIATRMIYEQPRRIETWHHLVESGFEEYEALFLSQIYWINADGSYRKSPYTTHRPFNPGSTSLKRLKNADYKWITGNMFSGNAYTPCNAGWDRADYSNSYTEAEALFLVGTAKKYTGMFPALRAEEAKQKRGQAGHSIPSTEVMINMWKDAILPLMNKLEK